MSQQRVLGISLSEGIRARHLFAYLLVALISSGYAGALSVLQPGLLNVMGIDQASQGQLTGWLSALQEIVLITTMGLFGVLADRRGRRVVYTGGLALVALGFFLYPHARSISELVIYRIIIALGSAAMVGMMVTVIADYATNKDRGKANGLQGFVATLGAFLPIVFGSMPRILVGEGFNELEAQQLAFAAAGSMGVFGAAVAAIGLAAKLPRSAQAKSESVSTMLGHGIAAVRDPGIALSYGAAFISRGDLAITGAFLSLWLMQYGINEMQLTPSEAMATLSVPRIMTVVCGAMLGSILMGFIADRVSRVTAVSMASGLAAAVYLSVSLIDDPTSPWVFGLLAVMGIAEIAAFVSSQALVGQQAPAERRGAVIGFFGVAGAIGILVGTAGGGWLFDKVSPAAPFVLFGVLNAAVFVWSLRVPKNLAPAAE